MSLIYSLYQIGAIKFGNFVLKSGKTSNIYLDLRQIISFPTLLHAVSQAIWDKIPDQHFDLVCGVPYTALPIATCLSLTHNFPMILRRKEKKTYGTKQQIEGKYEIGQRCLIIEDVVTSGMSILETANDLIAAGLKIQDAVVLIDRQQGGKQQLQNNHIQLHAVFTLQDILHELIKSDLLSNNEMDLINNFLKDTNDAA